MHKKLIAIIFAMILLASCSAQEIPQEKTETESTTNIEENINMESEEPYTETDTAESKDKTEVEKNTNNVKAYFSPLNIILQGITEEKLLEQHAFDIEKGEDGSLSCFFSKEDYEALYTNFKEKITSSLNEQIQNEVFGIKEYSINDDLKNLTIKANQESYVRQSSIGIAMPLYLVHSLNGDKSGLTVEVKDTNSDEIIDTYEYPNPDDEIPAAFLGNYGVCALDGFISKDYEGNDCLTVYILYQNNDSDSKSFYSTISTKAFQNGIQMDSTILSDLKEEDNVMKEIQPGYTFTVAESFILSDLENPVDIEIEEFVNFGNSGKVKKTFKLNTLR